MKISTSNRHRHLADLIPVKMQDRGAHYRRSPLPVVIILILTQSLGAVQEECLAPSNRAVLAIYGSAKSALVTHNQAHCTAVVQLADDAGQARAELRQQRRRPSGGEQQAVLG
ncbi:MAG: hypothetical protein V4508_24865 [Pseudomonadota bacterium]